MQFRRWAIPILSLILMLSMLAPVSLGAVGEDDLNDTTWGEDSLKVNADGSFSWKSNWTNTQNGVNYDVHGSWVPRDTANDGNGNTEVTTQITSTIYNKDGSVYSSGTEYQTSVRCWDGTWGDTYADCPAKPVVLPPPPPPPPPPKITCWDGSKVTNTSDCPPPPPPQQPTKTCADGSTVPATDSCPPLPDPTPPPGEEPGPPAEGGGGGGTEPAPEPEGPPPPPPCRPRSDSRSLSVAIQNYALFTPGGTTTVTARTSGTVIAPPTIRTSWGSTVVMTRVGADWEASIVATGGIGPGTITVSTTLMQSDGCDSMYGPSGFSRKVDVTLYKLNDDWEPPAEEEPQLLPANLTLEEYIEDCLTTPEPYYCGISLRMAREYVLYLRAHEHAYRWEIPPGRWEKLIRRIDSALIEAGDEPSGLLEPWPGQGWGTFRPFP